MARIFLSYASEQKDIADEINIALKARNHDVFFDRDDLPDGESFEQQIERGIKKSDAMIFLISPESVESGRFTLTELKYARKKWPNPSRKLLPVMVADTKITAVPPFLRSLTIMEADGNLTAEVASRISEMTKKHHRIKKLAAVVAIGGAVALGWKFYPLLTPDSSLAVADIKGCYGSDLFDAIASGNLTYDQALVLGDACATQLLPAEANQKPGVDAQQEFAATFASAATSRNSDERQAAALLTQGSSERSFDAFMALAEAADDPIQQVNYLRTAASLSFLENPLQSISAFESILAIDTNDLNALLTLSALYQRTGQVEKALEAAARISAYPNATPDWIASAKVSEATILRQLGRSQEAIELIDEARVLYQRSGNQWGIAQTRQMEAETHMVSGRSEQAEQAIDIALSIATNYNFFDVLIKVQTTKAQMLVAERDFATADDLFEEAKDAAALSGDRFSVSFIETQRGLISLQQGQLDNAEDSFKAALAASEEIDHVEGIAWAELNIGNTFFARNDLSSALTHYENAADNFVISNNHVGQVQSGMAISGTLGRLGNFQQAKRQAEETLETAQASGVSDAIIQALFSVAMLERRLGSVNEARLKLEAAQQQPAALNNWMFQAASYEQLAQIAVSEDQLDDARQLFGSALTALENVDADSYRMTIQWQLDQLR